MSDEMVTDYAKKTQVIDQCRVVAHLARALAEVHEAHVQFLHNDLVDIIGARSARLMEELGEMLNDTDAVSDDDEWTDPIFERAHQLFPAAALTQPSS